MRKNDPKAKSFDQTEMELAAEAEASELAKAFEEFLESAYGASRVPSPVITGFGIRHLDALLGGGIVSSYPVIFSSTPETGKSTLAYQFSKAFQLKHPNSLIIYLDIEGAGQSADSRFQLSRVEIFGLDPARFRYEPRILSIEGVFSLLDSLCRLKAEFEEKKKKKIYLLIVWDSLAATPLARIEATDDPNRMVGMKARHMTFYLDKYGGAVAFNQVTFIVIDQVRANLKVDPYAPVEKTVGLFKNYKAASSITSLQHRTAQWLFLSRGEQIVPAKDKIDVDGWELRITTEKNKFAPSKYTVTCIFDKLRGLDPFWSEYHFLARPTPSEEKMGMEPQLFIKTAGPYTYLEFPDLERGTTVTTEKFYRSKAKELYLSDARFKEAFDQAVKTAVETRIVGGLFRRS